MCLYFKSISLCPLLVMTLSEIRVLSCVGKSHTYRFLPQQRHLSASGVSREATKKCETELTKTVCDVSKEWGWGWGCLDKRPHDVFSGQHRYMWGAFLRKLVLRISYTPRSSIPACKGASNRNDVHSLFNIKAS